jgi:hypothetical protein
MAAKYVVDTLAELEAISDANPTAIPAEAVGLVRIGDKRYEWDGDSWVLKSVDGAALARISASDVALESSLSDSDGMTIAAATDGTMQTFAISAVWDYAIVDVGVIHDSDTLTLFASWDGGTTYRVVDPISLTTGAQLGAAGIIAGTLDSRAYKMAIHKATHLGFTKTGANASLAFTFYTGIG